ncbi:M48 family metallopeptidase [Xanthomonas graminis]|uniref:Zinc metalloprotease n=1 Tax=Xanthomonas graminis pv. phlei TaxID=487906 RepID=A0A0K2ZWP4_9XANT|nr:SprT family zinc-dependent metalloprotease [Xanthomonas translucens]UKE66692.1 M48 family metallopeptidase [Xanthomonas translucens pv. phlei]CTP90221.1 zinc metalloprotease [Xanthomonas translucens pv. phlei]
MVRTHIRLGELNITVTFKTVKNVHLSVHPPEGAVTLVAPTGTRLEVARAYAISKLRWIRQQQAQLQGQVREPARQFVTRESHYIWGRRYLLVVAERDAPPAVKMDHRRITLSVRPGTDAARREAIFQGWQRSLLHHAIPPLITQWEQRIGVKVSGYFLQRMKTKWGSCNHQRAHIRLNTELVKKPRDMLEYVIVHEMIHLIEPTHNECFIAFLDQFYPAWREARAELNALPLAT